MLLMQSGSCYATFGNCPYQADISSSNCGFIRCWEENKEDSSRGWKLHRLCCQQDVLSLHPSCYFSCWTWCGSLSNWQGDQQIWNANGPIQVPNSLGKNVTIFPFFFLEKIHFSSSWYHFIKYMISHLEWQQFFTCSCRLADLVGFGVAIATGMQFVENFPERTYKSMLLPLMQEDKRGGIFLLWLIYEFPPDETWIENKTLVAKAWKTASTI